LEHKKRVDVVQYSAAEPSPGCKGDGSDMECLDTALRQVLASVPISPSPPGKRVLDLLLSSIGLIASLPLWFLIAVAIKAEDRGPVFYRQKRVGLRGETFDVMKFRSMVQGAEGNTGPVWALTHDQRITKVGRLLRATAMDELPQLLNIFNGTMSFVGPRPERPEFVTQFLKNVRFYHRRFALKPGLTGLAQIYGRYNTPPHQKLRYDLLYARHAGIWFDFRLIALSFWISFRGSWSKQVRKW